jgi:hypothetical protein
MTTWWIGSSRGKQDKPAVPQLATGLFRECFDVVDRQVASVK